MCGIAAILSARSLPPDAEHSPSWLGCLDALKRRGVDGSGQWRAASGLALLGHTRLAIVDPSDAGAQPMTTHDGDVALTYNGEIYNAPELRAQLESLGHRFTSTCDTEVLLRGYLHWNSGILDRMHGMFAFVIWDERAGEMLAAVDHVGMKPLCWKAEGGRLLVTSDADAMRTLTGRCEALDSDGVRSLLTLGCCPAPLTMWQGIAKLEPGRLMRWTPGGPPRIERYWTPPEAIVDDRPIAAAAFDELFEQVVTDHMLADVPIGSFLSGGLDSAAIVAAAHKLGHRPRCYTLSMDGDDDESTDAARIAGSLGLEHQIDPAGTAVADDLDACVQAYDEPQGYSALLNAVRIARLASARHKTILSGDGGDETFGGYLWQREVGPEAWQHLPDRADLAREAADLATAVAQPHADDDTRKRARLAFGARSFVHAYASRVFPGFHPAEAVALTPGLDHESRGDATASCDHRSVDWLGGEDRPDLPHVRRVQRLDLLGFCPASILPKVDRAAMHHCLEVRMPLLDKRLIRIGLGGPVQPREIDSTGDGSRPALRAYAKRLLGDALSRRPKQGFSLRVQSELAQWREIVGATNDRRLVQTGVLREDWQRFVPLGDTPRLRLIGMLVEWAETRI